MSDPFYPYTGGGFSGAGGDGGPPRRYMDYEIDLIASRYADAPLPSLSSADVPLPILSPVEVGYFDAHLGAKRSAEGEGGPIPVLVSMRGSCFLSIVIVDYKNYLLLQSCGSYDCLLSSKHCGYILLYRSELEEDYLLAAEVQQQLFAEGTKSWTGSC
jgi:hypothetical protein